MVVTKFVEAKALRQRSGPAGPEARRMREDLIAKASVRLTGDALPVVAKVCDERMPCEVLNRCIELLCRNAIAFAGALYDASRGERPGALMTSFVMRGMKAPTDNAMRWAQRVVVREARTG